MSVSAMPEYKSNRLAGLNFEADGHVIKDNRPEGVLINRDQTYGLLAGRRGEKFSIRGQAHLPKPANLISLRG